MNLYTVVQCDILWYIMSSINVVWIVQLPPEYKETFEKLAEKEGDTSHGAGARQLRRFLKKNIEAEASE